MTDRVLTVTTHVDTTGPTVFTVAGELDYHTAGELRQVMQETPFTDGGVVVDLTELTYCDSTGITVLITAYHRARAIGARLALAGLNPDLQRVFGIIGLGEIFTFYPTLGKAIESF